MGHETVASALHAASRPVTGDDRSAAQRRADALVSVCRFFTKHALADPATSGVMSRGGEPPQLMVHVTWDTLRQAPGAPTATTGLGSTISGDAARRLACDARVARIITGPASEILDVGRASRTFTHAARRGVIARDRHCVWPGCHAPASWCEVHHAIHWAHGGPSNIDNGVLICGAHHDRVHHHRKPIRIRSDGSRTVELNGNADIDGQVIDERPPADGRPGRRPEP